MGSVIDAAAFEAIHSDINLPTPMLSCSPCIAPAGHPAGGAEEGEYSVPSLELNHEIQMTPICPMCVYTE